MIRIVLDLPEGIPNIIGGTPLAHMPQIDQNKRVQLSGHCLHGGFVHVEIENGLLLQVVPSSAELTGRYIAPGFFDIQVNGFGGRDFLKPDLTVEDVEFVARAVLATGVTRFLPTIITASLDAMCQQLSVLANAIERIPIVRQMCPGIHVEGPFLHPEDGPRGAHPCEHVREPKLADFERLREAARGRIAMLTLAPDQPRAAELIAHVTQQNIVVALGHHRADRAAIEAAVAAGAKTCTHLGNGCDAVLPRLENPIWLQLAEDRLWASFISDGHHLPAAALRCMLRAKTPSRSILVTDAMAAAGMPPGKYRLGAAEVERSSSGRVTLPGTPYLAGSGADMPLIISHSVRDGGVSFEDAVMMASLNPAKLLFGEAQLWPPRVGDLPNLVELDWDASEQRMLIRKAVIGPFAYTAESRTGA